MSADPTPPPLAPARWSRAQAAFDQLAETAPDTHAAGLAALFPDPADADLRELVAGMLAADADARLTGEQAWRSELVRESLGMSDWAAGTRIGPWQVEALVGRGGMGEVYRASRADGTVAQTVAIKRLSGARGHPEFERRFLAERRVLARLNHPHVARFLDAGADPDGRPYAVMEYVDGRPLTQHAWAGPAGGRPLDVRARVALLLQVADAVAHAHAQLVVHRDLKPGNVLVDAKGEPRLLDFGIAKALAEFDDTGNPAAARPAETEVGQRLFSLGYAAPEQLRGGAVGVQCDVYGLGGLLYELLTGRPPLQLDGLAYGEAERRVLEEWPKPPSQNVDPQKIAGSLAESQRSLKGDLDNIVLHALEKDPARRYGSVAAFIEDLQRHLDRQPISLRRDHRWYRFGRFVRRQWLPLGLASGIVIALGIGGVLLWQQSRLLEQERDAALRALTRAESVTRLLTNAFEAADPSRNEGKTLLAKDVLAVAAAELEHTSHVDPLTRLVLGTTLADVYRSMGDFQAGLELIAKIIAEFKLTGYAGGAEIARAWVVRSDIELLVSNVKAAEHSVEAAEAALSGLAGGYEVERLKLLHGKNRIGLLQSWGRVPEGLRQWKVLVEQAKSRLPENDPLTLTLAQNYAGRLLQSTRGEAEAHEIMQWVASRLTGPVRTTQQKRMVWLLATAARRLGNYDEAVSHARRHLEASLLLYGENHRNTAAAYETVGLFTADTGRFDEAGKMLLKSLELFQALPKDEVGTLLMFSNNNYADFLTRRLRDPVRAEPFARTAVQMAERLYPPHHFNRAAINATLAEVLLNLNRFEEALELLLPVDEIMAQREREAGVQIMLRAEIGVLIALSHHGMGSEAEASQALLDAWKQLRNAREQSVSRKKALQLAKDLGLALDKTPIAQQDK